jgi:outer membrane protein OmpA-like peptidoglycan-associated protein
MSILKIIGFSLGSILLLGQATVNAEEVTMYSTSSAPSGEEMGQLLFPKQRVLASTYKIPPIKMRGIYITPKHPVQSEASKSPQGSTMGLPIKFGYNSDKILGESKSSLAELGRMLSSPDYAHEKLLIEGHTDSSGSAQYNQYLSERRAESVKKYLRDHFNIASSRLFITGMGESQPLENVPPSASMNRRVQFRRAPSA